MADYTVKMTPEKADEARALFRQGIKVYDLCEKYHLSERAMRDLINGKSWNANKGKIEMDNSHSTQKVDVSNKWETVYALWSNGKTKKEIAEILSITPGYVSLIQWAVNSARKDPAWVDKQQTKKNRKLAVWADNKVRREITKEDWEYAACHFAKKADENRKHIELGALLRLFQHDTVQIHFEDRNEDWDKATELPADSPLLESVLSWRIKEAEIVESYIYDDQYILRLGIFEPTEGEECST